MALGDVKQYYGKMFAQYAEMLGDLNDYQEAVEAGHFTEEDLAAVKADVAKLKENVDRLGYILFLFEMPNRKTKKKRFRESHKNVIELFDSKNASESKVFDENSSIIAHLRSELAELKKKAK